jgi:hypothetical protein
MKLFIALGGELHQFATKKTPDRLPKEGYVAGLVIKKGLFFRPSRAQNGSANEKHGFSQCNHRLKKVTGCCFWSWWPFFVTDQLRGLK